MFCSYCGKKNDDDARFCLHCGTDLLAKSTPQQPVEVQPVEAQPAPQPMEAQPAPQYQAPVQTPVQQPFTTAVPPMQPGIQPKAPKVKRSHKVLIGSLAGVGCVAIAAGIGITMFLNTPEMVVARAVQSSASSMQEDSENLLKATNLWGFVEDAENTQYTASINLDDEAEITAYVDYGKKVIRADVGAEGQDLSVFIGEHDLVAQGSFLDDSYGICFDTLLEDLNNCSLIDLSLPEDQNVNPFEVDEALAEHINTVLSEKLVNNLLDVIEVEKVDPVKLSIEGKKREVDTFELIIDLNDLEDALYKTSDELFADQDVFESYDANIDMIRDILDESGQYYDESALVNSNDLQDLLEDSIDLMIYSMENEGFEDLQYFASVYKGDLAQIQLYHNYYDESIDITFESPEHPLSSIALTSNAGIDITWEMQLQDDYLEINFDQGYGSLSLDWDLSATHDNLTFSNGYDDYTLTVDVTEKNVIRYEGDVDGTFLEVTLDTNKIDGNLLKIPSEYENILGYDEDDFQRLAEEISNELYY